MSRPSEISLWPAAPSRHNICDGFAADRAPCAFSLHPIQVKSQSSHFLLGRVWPRDNYARKTWKSSFYFQYGFSADFMLAHHSVHHIKHIDMVNYYFILSRLIVFGNKSDNKTQFCQNVPGHNKRFFFAICFY